MWQQLIHGLVFLSTTAQAFTPTHPCVDYKTKVSKLQTCSTASAFCSSYLMGPASFTRTSAMQTTIGQPTTTVTFTSTDSSTITTTVDAGFVVTSTESTTTTMTTCATTCSSSNPVDVTPSRRRDEPTALVARARAAPSCGIISNAVPSQVSGACNCYLALSTTITSSVIPSAATITATVTEGPTTETVTTTQTTTSTTTISATACATPSTSAIRYSNSGTSYDGLYALLSSDGSGNQIIQSATPQITLASLFSVDTINGAFRGYLADGTAGLAMSSTMSIHPIRFNNTPSTSGDGALVCVDRDSGLFCSEGGSFLVPFAGFFELISGVLYLVQIGNSGGTDAKNQGDKQKNEQCVKYA